MIVIPSSISSAGRYDPRSTTKIGCVSVERKTNDSPRMLRQCSPVALAVARTVLGSTLPIAEVQLNTVSPARRSPIGRRPVGVATGAVGSKQVSSELQPRAATKSKLMARAFIADTEILEGGIDTV